MDRREKKIYWSWQNFIRNLDLEPYVVRPLVANSWHRSLRMKVDPFSPLNKLCLLSKNQIEKKVERRRKLIDTALPFMKHLYEFVRGSDTLVCLADDNGIILSVLSDPVIEHRIKHLCHVVGADWSESVAGTNAIGTALFEKRPVQIINSEHYCTVLHSLTGSAAPIFSPTKELLGVLYIVSLSQNIHPHTLGMVVASVKAVEHQLAYQKTAYELLIAYSKVKSAFETISDGLIVIENNHEITQLNSVGAKILQVNREDCLNKKIESVFGSDFPLLEVVSTGQEFTDKELCMETQGGVTRFTSTVRTVKDEFGNITGIIATLREIAKVHKLVNKIIGAEANMVFDNIVGSDPKLQDVIKHAKRVAKSGSTILIQGESGTGKEIFAQAIHNHSGRRRGPFIVVNCGSIPRDLVESELFGYEEGAFTGAKKGGRPGKFELANGGTIFLDEIGDMPLEIQASLLRVLQERQVIRIGGQKYIPVNTRVIAATNKDLQEEVKKGNFRLDLFYRLNVISLHIPCLKDRIQDIFPLTNYFIERISQRIDQKVPQVSPQVYNCLINYRWPGNIRELENVIENALHMVESDTLLPKHLPDKISNKSSLNRPSLHDAEAKTIKEALDLNEWNITKTADMLGVARNTLYRRINVYHLEREK